MTAEWPHDDVWEVKIDGLGIEDAPDGWLLCRSAIPRFQIRLVPAPERPA
jgi:hypothetical protein